MSYTQLKVFHAVATEGSVQRASIKLNVTQPAVSIHVRNLERESCKRLFRRSGHKFILTEDGKRLLDAATRMMEAEVEATRVLSASYEGYPESIKVGAAAPHSALDILKVFHERVPDVQIDLRLYNCNTTWKNLIELKTDVAVTTGIPNDSNIVRKPISKQKLVALIPISFEPAESDSVTWSELVDCPLLFREQGSYSQAYVDWELTKRSIRKNPVAILASREATIEAVIRGMGIGFDYEREVLDNPNYRKVTISDSDHTSVDELVCLNEQYKNPLIKMLFDCVDTLQVG